RQSGKLLRLVEAELAHRPAHTTDTRGADAELVNAETDQQWQGDAVRGGLAADLDRYPSMGGARHRRRDQLEHLRVMGGRLPRPGAIDAQLKLGQIVGADAEEV